MWFVRLLLGGFLLGVVASSSWRWSSMASFKLARDSSIVFPWLAMSRSGHHATYRVRDSSFREKVC